MSLVCVACGAENLESSSSDDVSAICHNCGNSLITAKQNRGSPALPPVKKIAIQDLTIQELIIRTMQFSVCYLVAIAMSCISLAFCVRDGGYDYMNIVAIVLLFGVPILSNILFFCAFCFFKKSAFNLRCFYSMLAGIGLTWMFSIIAGALRQLFNI